MNCEKVRSQMSDVKRPFILQTFHVSLLTFDVSLMNLIANKGKKSCLKII
jgi:hypothetical protein